MTVTDNFSPDGPVSLDFASLTQAYRDGSLTPSRLVKDIFVRMEGRGDDKVWIYRVPATVLLARAAALEALSAEGRAALPLWGIPFAVKDNIDVAGLATTAACPARDEKAKTNALVVNRLLAAGAILIGKTNLDQFATGLVGVRSPHGVPRNPFNPAIIPGGSSSGSAVAVAAGLVSFALGTDTAGSGRVPAGFNNIVGIKPTKGLVSTAGVLPACRSLDCVSVFALTVEDGMAVLDVMAGQDRNDPFSRVAPPMPPASRTPPRFGVPRDGQLRFFGDAEAERIYTEAVARMEALGGRRVEIDLTPFTETADLLYNGPWVAERMAAVGDFIATHPGDVLEVTSKIILGGAASSAVDCFRAMYRLGDLRAAVDETWRTIDVLLLPTSGTIYSLAEVEADPVQTNSNLGIYTNFTNLLDLCGIAVPAAMRNDGLPSGITMLAPAFREAAVAAEARAFHRDTGLPLGATGFPQPSSRPIAYGGAGLLKMLVVGGHLSGQGLNWQLTDVGARLVAACLTAPRYRLYALSGEPPRPGMVPVAEDGVAIEGEIWEMTPEDFGRFVAAIPGPLGVGQVELADGGRVCGFQCSALAVHDALDISAFGGWRAWRASLQR